MQKKSNQSILNFANEVLRNKDYAKAIELYERALKEVDDVLSDRIRFNLDLARRRLGKQDSSEAIQQKKSNNLSKGYKDEPLAKPHPITEGKEKYIVEEVKYIQRLALDAPKFEKAARIIAFYLPQFHPIPENDAWWGKGFTDWDNVKRAKPQFAGHYQPHIPDTFLGNYDLRDTAVMHKQIELAKQYGIEGFCFYTYWFKGHRLLETPLENYFADTTLDLPFCICWANENWSRRWDGLDQDLLIQQDHSPKDDIAFIAHMSKYLVDSRYIRIEGKPLLIVYRPNLFPSMQETAKRWREWCRKNGIGEIYLAYVQSFVSSNPKTYGLDAAIEFPPNNSEPPNITNAVKSKTQEFTGKVYDWRAFLERSQGYKSIDYTLFRGVCPSWDNTARKNERATIFTNSSPNQFERWLTRAIEETRNRVVDQDKSLVFINAWNEWAEGAHLEPDQRYGYAWLDAVRNSHINFSNANNNELKNKTLLFVDYALPMYDRYAGSRSNYMYLLLLVKMGMKVVYLPGDFSHVEPYSTELKKIGVEILAGDWFRANWKEWFKENGKNIEYTFLHKPSPAIQFLEVIIEYTKAPVIYQCHDLHYLRLQRQAELTNDSVLQDEADFYKEKENYLFSVCDSLLTFSSVEEGIIKKGFPHKQVHTVPLFFYDEAPKPKVDYTQRNGLLYVGGFDHTPNRDAVLWFLNEVFPIVLRHIPDVVFNIVGANPSKEITSRESANVKVHGKVSEAKLESLYASVRLSVVPLRVGAGVKGKVIEALYHAVPLVGTSIALEGIIRIEEAAQARDTPVAFADEILKLYKDKDLWLRRSALSSKFVSEHFTSGKTAEQIRKIFAAAKTTAAERCNPNAASLEQNPLRTIAFHLPQYHPIPENDEWWGKGFTEWRNVSKAKPLFDGHYQPHVPADLGFYDLRLPEARIAQADLARKYGINGFCYYHYWFNGKRLLERPVEEILSTGKPDFPFCLCWANENWTRRWDGQDSAILIEQVYSEADDRAHINDLFRFFRDPRYIRINGKPLFLVYRTENIPDPAKTAKIWREEAHKAGIGDLYLVRVESAGKINPQDIGFDAALEFAPDWERLGTVARSYQSTDSDVTDIVQLPKNVYETNYTRSYIEMMNNMLAKEQPSYPWFRSVTPSWDNSARRSENAVILLGSSPSLYQQWLEKIIVKTISYNDPAERIVFINAWNEWAEGNHLEPCQKWGHSYLDATTSGIQNSVEACLALPLIKMQFPLFFPKVLGEEGTPELANSIFELVNNRKSPHGIIISFEDFNISWGHTYMKGWAAIADGATTEGTDIQILVNEPGDGVRLIIPAKRKRPEITQHFVNVCNYDHSGFEALTKRIGTNANVYVIIKRGSELFWQAYK